MKLHSYAIREALRERQHKEAARLLAAYHGLDIGQQAEINISYNHHTDYAIRIWIGRRGFEWDAGEFYSMAHSGGPRPTEIVIWSPHENR